MPRIPTVDSDSVFMIQHLLHRPSSRRSVTLATSNRGFTIVELLIVIVVIGILVAIVVVAYTGVTNSANEAAVKSDLTNIGKKLEEYKVRFGSGNYPANTTQLDSINFKVAQDSYVTTRNNFYYYRSEDAQHYAIGAVSTTGTGYYLVDGTIEQAPGVVWGADTRAKIDVTGTDDNSDGTVDNVVGSTGFNGTTFQWSAWLQ